MVNIDLSYWGPLAGTTEGLSVLVHASVRDQEQMLRKANCLLCSWSRVGAGGLGDVGVRSSLGKAHWSPRAVV